MRRIHRSEQETPSIFGRTKRPIGRRDFLKSAGAVAAGAAVFGAAVPGASALGRASAASQDKPGQKTAVLALVGCAHIHTPSYIGLLKKRSDVKVKYVWDHDRARGQRRAGELGAKYVSNDGDVWSDKEVTGAVICSETNRHRDLVLAGGKAAKPMFVEKPLGTTALESYEMAAAIGKAGLPFTTGYFMRTLPHYLFLKEQVVQGHFGTITRVRGSNCHEGSLGGWFDGEWRWMADPKIAGVGAFGDLGTHALDIMMWLMGDVESVAADIRAVTHRYADCDETGEALLKFKGGIIGTLAAGWVDVANPVTFLISGTEGHAAIIRDELYFTCKKVEGADGATPWRALPAALPAPLDQFVDAVLGKPAPALVAPRDAAARVSVMEAAYAASAKGTWVEPA